MKHSDSKLELRGHSSISAALGLWLTLGAFGAWGAWVVGGAVDSRGPAAHPDGVALSSAHLIDLIQTCDRNA